MGEHQYNDPDKRKACETIWDVLATRVADGPALMLPGPLPHEFNTALRHGYKPENLYLVEDGSCFKRTSTPIKTAAAIKSLFTRRFPKGYPLQWQKGHLSDVCKALVDRGVQLAAAHLDFCKPLGFLNTNSPAVELEKFIKSGVMLDGLLATTVLAGREQDGTDNDEVRFRRMERAISVRLDFGVPRTAELIKRGKYWNKDTKNPMIWGIFEIARKKK